jgi:hypothetical protein
MSRADDACGDAAAYLLGALEPAEEERFRAHAEQCVLCREELTSLEGAVDALPLTATQHPAPKALRRRVMRQVRASTRSARTARPTARRPRALVGALAAASVALAVIGTVELGGSGSNAVRVIQANVSGVPGSAQLRVAGQHAELLADHLPPPPRGRIYELWIKRGDRPPSPTSSLFSVTASGGADVGVPGSLHGVTEIMVTAEPAGGSLAPTRAPVIVARLT